MKNIGKIIFVVCKNDDKFHGDTAYHLQHVIQGDEVASFPDREYTAGLLASNAGVPVVLMITPCASCRRKGVTGPTDYRVVNFEKTTEENKGGQ